MQRPARQRLVIFLLLFCGCSSVKKETCSSCKWSVATIESPHVRQSVSHHHHQYYSAITFPADSAGHSLTVNDTYNAKENDFFYKYAKKGDRFAVRYDSLRPHRYQVYSTRPFIDAHYSDTVTGSVKHVLSDKGYVEFEYLPGDSLHKGKPLLRFQDIRIDSLPGTFHFVKKGEFFPVVFDKRDHSHALVLLDGDLNKESIKVPGEYKGGGSHHAPKHFSQRVVSRMDGYSSTRARLGLGMGIGPFLAYNYTVELTFPQWHIGVDITRLNNRENPDRLSGDPLAFSPFFKLYAFKEDYSYAPGFSANLYIEVTGTFSQQLHMESHYYNMAGIPDSLTPTAFLSQYPNGKVYTGTNSFKIYGGGAGLFGFTCFFGKRHRIMLDDDIGIYHAWLPNVVVRDRTVNGEKFYYHDSPWWDSTYMSGLIQGRIIFRF